MTSYNDMHSITLQLVARARMVRKHSAWAALLSLWHLSLFWQVCVFHC